ncbi:MAG: glucosamine-6-phosphate deaminase [Candidatus Bipolaricaulia bacterium]
MPFEIKMFETKDQISEAAAQQAAELLRKAIDEKGEATFVAATGTSQFEFLAALVKKPSIDWSKTTMFHLDEYIGLPEDHPASFRKYLKERLIDQVHPGTVHLIQGDAEDPEAECERLNQMIGDKEIDVTFVGVGENGHLAFNDPPADFETEKPYIIVELDKRCREQQVGEGWFKRLDDVPRQAISMSIQQIMRSKHIICTVPGWRKAQAVKQILEAEISPQHPASILREHESASIYLDKDSSALLR